MEAASLAMPLVAAEPLDAVALIDRGEGRTDVFEFVVDVQRDFAQADDQAEDGDRGDEDEFGGDDETSFVTDKGVQEAGHGVGLFSVGCWLGCC